MLTRGYGFSDFFGFEVVVSWDMGMGQSLWFSIVDEEPYTTSIYQLWPEVGCWQWTPEERWCTSGTNEGGTPNVPNLPWFGTTTQPFPPFDAELWDLIFSKISSNETPKMWTLDILRLTRNDMGFVEGFGTPQMCHAGVKSILQAESGGESGSQLQRRSFHRCMFSEL